MSEQSGRSEQSDRPSRSDQSRADRRQQANRDADLIGDLQRWLIRSSAKNVRRELEDQVRRTLGGQRQDKADVWDVATTEIPPEVGAAPECQWCPICRAARRMRESGPGVAGPLSGAGEAVATVMQDAISALDSLLARTGGRGGARDGADRPAGRGEPGSSAQPTAGRRSAPTGRPAEDTEAAARPDSPAGEHGQVGWKPGDRLATAGGAAADPWATATDRDPAADGTETGGAGDESDGGDGRGHGPSDRR